MSIESRLNFEKVISTISSRFVGKINLDSVIDSSFQEMGNFSNADRVSLFLFNGDNNYIRNTHEWCAIGINSKKNILQDISVEQIILSIDDNKDNQAMFEGYGIPVFDPLLQ